MLEGTSSLVSVPDSYSKLPLQLKLHARIVVMPGAFACCCIDIDRQGKAMRDLCVKGEWMTVFPHVG